MSQLLEESSLVTGWWLVVQTWEKSCSPPSRCAQRGGGHRGTEREREGCGWVEVQRKRDEWVELQTERDRERDVWRYTDHSSLPLHSVDPQQQSSSLPSTLPTS